MPPSTPSSDLALLEGADVQLASLLRAYRELERSVRRHRFPTPPAPTFTSLDRAAADARRNLARAQSRLTPTSLKTLRRLDRKMIEARQRVIEATARHALPSGLGGTTTELLQKLYLAAPATPTSSHFPIQLLIAALATFAMLPLVGSAGTLAFLVWVPTSVVVVCTVIDHRGSRPLTALAGALVSLAPPALMWLRALMTFGKC